jgi:hypothetical protein
MVAEYLDTVNRCPHCDTPLVPGLLARPTTRTEWQDLVEVAFYLEVHRALAARVVCARPQPSRDASVG